MKKIVTFLAPLLIFIQVNSFWDTNKEFKNPLDNASVDMGSLTPPPLPGQPSTIHYYPDKVQVTKQTIVPNGKNPLPVYFPQGLPLNVNFKDLLVTIANKTNIPISFDQKDPLIVRLELPEDGGEEILENFMAKLNEALEETIAPGLKQSWQTLVGTFLNMENAVRFGTPIALFGIVTLSGFYGARVAWKVIEKNLLSPKPQILQPGSKYGWLDRWKRKRNHYKTPEMIFDASVELQLNEIQEKTKNIRNNIRKGRKITYDNLLLYGKPGTGKTLFAHILADYTDMDFLCVTAASLLQSGVEGIKHFDEIMEMAEKSTYGVILFIDEADALFINRDSLKPDSDHYKVLNHILAATGSGSSKIMIIAATNHAYVMDPAMGRRFQERIKMPLPDEKTRKKLLMLYLNEYLLNISAVGATGVQKARSIFTENKINEIIHLTAGLSHAEIKDMIMVISKKASASANGILTPDHVKRGVTEAVEKKKALIKDSLKYKKKVKAKLSEVEAAPAE